MRRDEPSYLKPLINVYVLNVPTFSEEQNDWRKLDLLLGAINESLRAKCIYFLRSKWLRKVGAFVKCLKVNVYVQTTSTFSEEQLD